MTKWIAAPRKRSSMGDDEPGSPVVKVCAELLNKCCMLTPTAHCPLPYLQSRKRIHRQISNFFTRFKKRTGFEELRKRIKVQPILHSAMQSTVCVSLSHIHATYPAFG